MKKRSFEIMGIIFLFIVYMLILFLIADSFTPTFWIVFIFCLFSCLIQALTILKYMGNRTVENYFYTAPIARYAMLYLIIQYVIALIFIIIDRIITIPNIKITLVVELILAAIFVFIIGNLNFSLDRAKDIQKDKMDSVSNMRNLSNEAKSILESITDYEWKRRMKKIYDEIQYTDPVSKDETLFIENKISEELDSIRKYIQTNNLDEFEKSVKQIRIMLADLKNS